MTTYKASIGTISEGTLRNEDLIPAFLDELGRLDEAARDKIRDDFGHTWDEDWNYDSAEAFWMVEALADALNDHAPTFCYFGATDGDGADFGFWPNIEAAEEESLKVNDLDEVPADYAGMVMLVNDHGNVTIYFADKGTFTEEWSVV